MCIPQNDAFNKKLTIFQTIYVHFDAFWKSMSISLQFHIYPIFSQGTDPTSDSAHVPRLESNSVIRSSSEVKVVTSAVLVEPI